MLCSMYKIFFINFQAHIHAEDPVKQDYALAMRVSVMDVRSAPEWTAWAEWIGCETCGDGKTRSRTKTCECATPPCFPCPGGPCNATDTNPGQCEADEGICQKNES